MALTSNENPAAQSKAAGRSTGRIAQIAGGFWLGRIWLAKAWLRRLVLIVLGLFAALLLFLKFALPPIAIAQAERVTQQMLHRRLVIDQVEVHPFSLTVFIRGARLMEPDGATVFASFDELEVRVSPSSLVYFAPVVREVHLARPFVHLVRTAPNAYSTDDIVATLAAAAPTPAPTPAPAPARFAVYNIHIDGGHFEFDDIPKSAHHTVTEFALGIPFISSFIAQEEVFVEPHLRALVNGAPLQVGGKALPFAPTREAIVNLDFDDIDLPGYIEYLPAAVPFRMPSGRLDLHIQANAQLPKDQAPQLHLAGKVTLKALELTSLDNKPLLKLSEVELAITEANLPSGRVDAAVTIDRKGRIAAVGETAIGPLHADLDVQIDDLNLLPLQPLFSDRVNLRVTRALLASKAHVKADQAADGTLQGLFQGDVTLAKLATVDAVNSNDFVSWDALAVRGARVQLSPLAVHVDQVALKSFYARVIIDPSGRINLQDIVRAKAEAKRSLTEAPAAAPAPAEAGKREAAQAPDATPAAGPNAPAPASAAAAAPPVSIGKVVLEKGHVRFTDNFIQPKYTADLMDLGGSVSGLSSDPQSAADIDLHGRVNDAPLLIGGRINPLARDLTLDVKASVHGMELAPLTTYSNKYVGYRIERGKLSFDVAYQLANRQLHAENRLVLDQLTFGDKVESPSATTLPVLLAVALLKDRNGVIDINLPIGGSLDDPEFSVGGIIVKVLINLITKAVTAPFALLGKLFGGGEELSWLDFAPGQSEVTPEAEAKLKSLASALTERPGLKLDISGSADPQSDRDALRQARIESKLRAIKRKDLAEQGKLVTSAEVTVSPEERPELLKRLYESELEAKSGAPKVAPSTPAAIRAEAAAAAKKPQPTQEQMEEFLRANQQISDEDLLALGNRRAQAVKQWLSTIGMIPDDRMSLVAAKIAAPAEEAPPGAPNPPAPSPVAPAPAEATTAVTPAAPSPAAVAPAEAAPAPATTPAAPSPAAPAAAQAAPSTATATRSASRVNFALH